MQKIVCCKYCGATILKTEEAIIGVLHVTSKCPNPNCNHKGLLRWPEDIKVKEETRLLDAQ